MRYKLKKEKKIPHYIKKKKKKKVISIYLTIHIFLSDFFLSLFLTILTLYFTVLREKSEI